MNLKIKDYILYFLGMTNIQFQSNIWSKKSDFIALVTYYSVQDQIGFQNQIIKKNYFSPIFFNSYLKLRTACTNEDDFEGRFWCATKVDSNLESIGDNWGYCSGSCPLESQNQNGAPKIIKTTTVAPNIFRKRTTTKAPIPKVSTGKVEKNKEDSLDSIPSPLPSVKIQIVGGKIYLT